MPEQQPLSRSNLVKNILVILLCLGFVPFTILSAALVPPARMISFIGAILAFQPFAASVGLVLGIHPTAILATMLFVGFGAVTAILTLCDLFAHRLDRLANAIRNVQEHLRHSERFRKFGIVMLFPFIWVPGLGLYGCTMVAWLFNWRQVHHIIVLMAAWMVAVIIVLATSLGVLSFAIS
jgi:uncharacterized membrane protein